MGQISEYMMELGQQTFNDPKARDHMQEEMLKIIAPLMKDKRKVLTFLYRPQIVTTLRGSTI